MKTGVEVRSLVALPSIPEGSVGVVKEVGRLFIVVEFGDGRMGYYAPRQLAPVVPTREQALPAMIDLGFTPTNVVQGSHLCLVPETRQEIIPTISEYIVAGLRAGERCVCAASRRWSASLQGALSQLWAHTDRALASEDLRFLDPNDAYTPGEEFSAGAQLRRTEAFISAMGGTKVRALGVVGTTMRQCPPDEWWEYERHATALLRDLQVTAICVYDPASKRSERWRRAHETHPWMVRGGELIPGGALPM